MHVDAVTGRGEFLLFKDFLHLKMKVYIHIYIFLGGSKLLQQLYVDIYSVWISYKVPVLSL